MEAASTVAIHKWWTDHSQDLYFLRGCANVSLPGDLVSPIPRNVETLNETFNYM
jgi:hypothetical protein